MKSSPSWISFSPTRLSATATHELLGLAAEVRAVCAERDLGQRNQFLERLRKKVAGRKPKRPAKDDQRLLVASHILIDLAKQGWLLTVADDAILVARPTNPLEPEEDRQRIRQQLHAERDEQLRQESVRAFIRSMETNRFFEGKSVSIFSLMRDGRDLAEKLRVGGNAIQPYLQFVQGEEKCQWTGLRLVDIWRYFRHTWATPYKSVPGRSMMILVRDEGAKFHPIIGIAALSSATVGLSVRDESIGWTFRQVVDRVLADPSTNSKYIRWMLKITDEAISDIYKEDLFSDEAFDLNTLRLPTDAVIQNLIGKSRVHRKEHYRFMQGEDYKGNEDAASATPEYWEEQAKSLLFKAKREQELANLLQIRRSMNEHLGPKPTPAKVKAFLGAREGRVALTKLIRKAKADRVGTVIADLTICGAVPPYGEILAGKLVAMLMTSPEVVEEYHRRYRKTPSIIASSMAGRAVVRPAHLVYISTTSLYGRRPNQYDRIAVPVDRIQPGAEGVLRYEYLGRTKGIGTFQFGVATVEEMGNLLAQTSRGQRVNSVFGEGVNPRLRKIRDALDELGLPSNALLDHGAPRLVYGVSLIQNLTDYLLGIDKTPKYIVTANDRSQVNGRVKVKTKPRSQATERISEWWSERWCRPRVAKDGVLDEIAVHTLVYPIRHGARAKLPPSLDEEPLLFQDEE